MTALVLTLDTPPGPPWSQMQIARLQARHRSPIPLERVEILLARARPWRLGAEGRFHAAIVRNEDAPAAGEALEQIVDGELVCFEREGAAARQAAPLIVVLLLAVVAATTATLTAIAAGEVAPGPRAAGVAFTAPVKQQIAAQNAQVVDDLIAVRDAFGSGGTLRIIDWTPEAAIVETERMDASSVVGDGRAFEKLPRAEGTQLDRWRLTHGARR